MFRMVRWSTLIFIIEVAHLLTTWRTRCISTQFYYILMSRTFSCVTIVNFMNHWGMLITLTVVSQHPHQHWRTSGICIAQMKCHIFHIYHCCEHAWTPGWTTWAKKKKFNWQSPYHDVSTYVWNHINTYYVPIQIHSQIYYPVSNKSFKIIKSI